MTKKDYILIADALRSCHSTDETVKLSDLVASLSSVFYADNSHFDADRFASYIFKK